MSFQLTKAATGDLKSIARFTQEKWGKAQRKLYLKQLDEGFKLLEREPGIGKRCDEIREGYRKFPLGSHIVFYRIHDSQLEIVRILHKRMDIKGLNHPIG